MRSYDTVSHSTSLKSRAVGTPRASLAPLVLCPHSASRRAPAPLLCPSWWAASVPHVGHSGYPSADFWAAVARVPVVVKPVVGAQRQVSGSSPSCAPDLYSPRSFGVGCSGTIKSTPSPPSRPAPPSPALVGAIQRFSSFSISIKKHKSVENRGLSSFR